MSWAELSWAELELNSSQAKSSSIRAWIELQLPIYEQSWARLDSQLESNPSFTKLALSLIDLTYRDVPFW